MKAQALTFANEIGEHAKTASPEQLYELVEAYHKTLSKKLWESGCHTISESDFDIDLNEARDQSRQRNDFFFQYTVMMYSTDHWRFNDTFACSCNQAWRTESPALLLRKNKQKDLDRVFGLRPNLSICFQEDAVRGKDGDEMQTFSDPTLSYFGVFPEGTLAQCFPFFMIEAKKASGDMSEARIKSFYSATRALNNIYLCMRRAKKIGEVFQYARTFSMNVTPEDFEVRIHRLVWNEKTDEVKFTFDILEKKSDYTRNEIAAVFRVIAVEYAKNFLLPWLQDVYEVLRDTGGNPTEVDGEMLKGWKAFSSTATDLTEANLLKIVSKRKADDELGSSPKRPHTSQTAHPPDSVSRKDPESSQQDQASMFFTG